MAIVKVGAGALVVGALFVSAGMFLLNGLERSAGGAAPIVIMGLGCTGLLLGGMAGAAQAVVDAVRNLR
jgi:hypothetical protein